jgi:hypothetical protein
MHSQDMRMQQHRYSKTGQQLQVVCKPYVIMQGYAKTRIAVLQVTPAVAGPATWGIQCLPTSCESLLMHGMQAT